MEKNNTRKKISEEFKRRKIGGRIEEEKNKRWRKIRGGGK